LERLEEFFSIDLFKKRPELYYDFANQSNLDKYEPTPAHVKIMTNVKFGIII